MSNAPAPAPEPYENAKAPGTLKQFWWDMLPQAFPDRLLPPRSGFKPPTPRLDWVTEEMAKHPEALPQTRRAHDLERERADSLEKKASSVATLCLSLLATALAMGGYQLAYVREHPSVRWWLLAPAALSVVFLALATIRAMEIQRVGMYQWEGAEPLGRGLDAALGLVLAEEKGRQVAHWSAGLKADGFLQVRAWLSRSLVALVFSAFVVIGIASRPPNDASGTNVVPRTTTSTPMSSTSTSTRVSTTR